MAETIRGWQCIGCGRVEAPQNCIGVCRDRKVELVYASELAEAEGRLAGARDELAALRAFALKLAGTRPRDGQWEKSLRSFQDEARALLAKRADGGAALGAAGEPADTDDTVDASRSREA